MTTDQSQVDDEIRLLHQLRQTPALLAAAAEPFAGTEFHRQEQLRRSWSAELVREALTLVELRRRAAAKFSRPEALWVTRTGLEQATPEAVARYKAQRFRGAIWDYCGGIGADAMALAQKGLVTTVDRSAAMSLRAQWNAEAYGVSASVRPLTQDIGQLQDRDGWLHIDPDRRAGVAGRALRIEDYQPGLEALQQLAREFRGGAIKLGPATNFGGKFADVEIELISLMGECKEATVWFGEFAGTHPCRATVLPAGATLAGHPLQAAVAITPLEQYLYDPDPAVVRAGLVDVLAETLQLTRLDDAEEYLTGPSWVESPFVRGFYVLDRAGFRDRDVKQAVEAQQWGQVEIKCRHLPIDATTVRRKLKLTGTKPGVLIYAKEQGKAIAILAERGNRS